MSLFIKDENKIDSKIIVVIFLIKDGKIMMKKKIMRRRYAKFDKREEYDKSIAQKYDGLTCKFDPSVDTNTNKQLLDVLKKWLNLILKKRI